MKILIPFKEISTRCPNKNFILFPYVYQKLKEINVEDNDIVVISNSQKVKIFIPKFNVHYIEEPKREYPNDLFACLDTAVKLNIDKYIELPLPQPIRDYSILKNIESYLTDDVDFVVTYQNATDRSIFYLDDNDKFLNESSNRKGVLCKDHRMIDGAIYCIKTSFMKSIENSDDINHSFWNGNFKAIKNDVPFFIDIDTQEDMRRFSYLSSFSFLNQKIDS